MDTPPPLPARQSRRSFFHTAATASFLAFPIAILFGLACAAATGSVEPPYKGLATGAITIFSALIFIVGIFSGAVALFGIPKHGTRGILVKALCGIVIPVGLAALALPMAQAYNSKLIAKEKIIDLQLALVAKQLTKESPKMIDEYTRLDRVDAQPERTLVYTYTILNVAREDLPDGVVEKDLRPDLVGMYVKKPEMKYFRDNGVTVEHVYNDSKGTLVGKTSVGPGDIAK
jgi:hypothetical protein